MRTARKKKSGGKWRGLTGFFIGVTFGMGAAAGVVAYVNKLHLPFIEPPTRSPGQSAEQTRKQSEEEALQFREVLRSRQPQPLQEDAFEDAPTSAGKLSHYLQIAAFRDSDAAEELRGEMLLRGRKAVIRPGQTADGTALYRVWVGPYEKESEAEAVRAEMVLEGFENISLLKTSG